MHEFYNYFHTNITIHLLFNEIEKTRFWKRRTIKLMLDNFISNLIDYRTRAPGFSINYETVFFFLINIQQPDAVIMGHEKHSVF